MHFEPNRAAGLRQLEGFLSEKLARYERERNYVLEEGAETVSGLSPYIRLRLIRESEVCQSVLERSTIQKSHKFLQEVLWRNYWKGWLELRPTVWDQYQSALERLKIEWASETCYLNATAGETGILCFDDWQRELRETGYLHNHCRMWFASIWIFTLGLPWQLGAAFFLEHLLDADPASNTLSWRWVAGLQTKGKAYRATAENIRKYTDARYFPKGQLAENVAAPDTIEPPAPREWSAPQPEASGEYALLLTPEDLSVEHSIPGRALRPKLILIPAAEEYRHWYPKTHSFITAALEDARRRAEHYYRCPSKEITLDRSALPRQLEQLQVSSCYTAYPFVGPWRSALEKLGVFSYVLDPWDAELIPQARRGFFPFQKAVFPLLPELIARNVPTRIVSAR